MKPTHWAIITLFLLALLIRSTGLDTVPPALNSDELLKSFDGASVYRTGQDHHGQEWPLFFKQSGEYSPPLYIYWSGFFSTPLGVNAYSTRLPSAMMGAITIIFMFYYARELAGPKTAWTAALLLVLSPWHIHYSRLGWEAISLPFLMIAGLWLFTLWKRLPALTFLLGSTACFALTFYSYPAARLFTPLMLIALVVLNHKTLKRFWPQTNIAFLLFILIIIPFVIAFVQNYENIQVRFQFLSVFQQENGILLFIQHYFEHFSPLFLFVTGDNNPLHSMPGGLALTVLFPFVILGLYSIIKYRTPDKVLLLIWLLLFAIPSSLTYDRYAIDSMPNALRATCGLGLLELLGSIGIVFCYERISTNYLRRIYIFSLAILILINVLVISWFYCFIYPNQSADDFQYGIKEVVHYLEEHKSNYDQIIIDPNVRLHPISLATFSGMKPQPFSGSDFPKYIIHFQNYVPIYQDFGFRTYLKHSNISRWYTQSEGRNLIVVKARKISVGEPVYQVHYPDGTPAYEIFENMKMND